jgi:DNA-binding NarL/FixJ family response regulator
LQSELKILFLDDHAGLRDGIGYLLSQKNGRLSFFYAESREKGEKILSEHEEISLAIIDLNLNGGEDGLCALKAFRKIRTDLAAIVFTMYADPLHIESALRAGVQGYITKDAEIEELESAILAVAAGGNCFNKAAQKIIQSLLSPESAKTEDFSYMNYKSLTKAEQEVFALLAQKKEVGEIARILRKKEKTVQNQKSLICQKLNVRDRLELIEFAKHIGVLF